MHYFARYFQQHLLQAKKAPFFDKGQLGNHLPANAGLLADLTDLLTEYEDWLRELGQGERRFAGLRLDEPGFNRLVADQGNQDGLPEKRPHREQHPQRPQRNRKKQAQAGKPRCRAQALRWLIQGASTRPRSSP
ncbi:MAG: hypothetical protein WKG07_23325 [Hymenobacter sp.]